MLAPSFFCSVLSIDRSVIVLSRFLFEDCLLCLISHLFACLLSLGLSVALVCFVFLVLHVALSRLSFVLVSFALLPIRSLVGFSSLLIEWVTYRQKRCTEQTRQTSRAETERVRLGQDNSDSVTKQTVQYPHYRKTRIGGVRSMHGKSYHASHQPKR